MMMMLRRIVRPTGAWSLRNIASAAATGTQLSGGNFIAGRVSSEGQDTYQALSPMGQIDLPGVFHNATEAEITSAVMGADVAFQSYRNSPAASRATFLRTIGAEIEALGETLVERTHLETGLPLPRIRNERARTVDQLGKFADLVEEGSWVNARLVVGSGLNLRRQLVRSCYLCMCDPQTSTDIDVLFLCCRYRSVPSPCLAQATSHWHSL